MTSDLYAALGRIPSGIYILTVGVGDDATGMLASWVMQAGFEPPMVTVAVRHERYIAEEIARGEQFVLNQVGEGQKALLRHFGKGFEPGEPAFAGLEVLRTGRGVPILAGTVGWLECECKSHVESADHHIFLSRVTSGGLQSDLSPMVHVRNSGTHY